MKPSEFPEQNLVIAKDQPPYLPLPVFVDYDTAHVTSCWTMNWRERIRAALTGRVYVTILTCGHPLQPQIVSTEAPKGEPR